jgi:hypothetical protein
MVNVTATVPGSYVNTIPVGALQTSAGNNAVAASATLSVTCPVITLGPPLLANGTVGTAYSQTITASGGTAPYTFAVVSGTLPAGVVMSTAGVLSGTPTTAGTSPFIVRATDANSCTADLPTAIAISPDTCPVITLAPATIPNGFVGTPFSQTLTASGGTAPYTFAMISGALPTGVALTSVSTSIGLLSGTPTTNGSYAFTLRVTDSLGCLLERSSVVVITTAVPTMPQMFLMLLAVLLTTIGYVHLRKA